MNCVCEVITDITIKITNNSSQDLHISFYPNTFTSKIGVKYKFNDINVKKGDSFSLLVKHRYKRNCTDDIVGISYGPYIDLIEKAIFSKPDTGEIIKEVYNIADYIITVQYARYFTMEITDELIRTDGE